MSELVQTENKLETQKQVHIPTGGLTSTTHTSQTPVAPVVTATCHTKKLAPPPNVRSEKKNKQKNLHSPLVLSHELGGELAEDVEESQVEWRASFSLRTRLLKCKLDTVPKKCPKAEKKNWFHRCGCSKVHREKGNLIIREVKPM